MKEKRALPRPLIITLIVILILACAAGIYLALGDAVPSPRAIIGSLFNLSPLPKSGIQEDLAAMARSNPEAAAFAAAYTSPAPFPQLNISSELTKGTVPRLCQWDTRWGYYRYGTGLMGYTGCGPTALSMVLCGLTGNGKYHPAYVAKFASENGYCVPGNGTSWKLFSEGAEKLGLKAKELALTEALVARELESGRPIICIMGPGHFTTSGHYIVLTGYADGSVDVLDPYRESSSKAWRFSDISGEIRNLWSYEAAS